MAKILVLTGSPRKKGNSFKMTEAFIEEAKSKGHEVVRFDSAFMNLKGCRACDTCFSKGYACSLNDDFNQVEPHIKDCDVIIFSMPVWWYSIPSHLKIIIDKLYVYFCSGTSDKIKPKKYGIIACSEETDMSLMDGVRTPIERSCYAFGWENLGEVLITGAKEIGAIDKTDGCKRAKMLADMI